MNKIGARIFNLLDSLKIKVSEKVLSLLNAASIEEIAKVYGLKKRKHFYIKLLHYLPLVNYPNPF